MRRRRRALGALVGAIVAAGGLLLPAHATSSREVVLPALHTNAPNRPVDIVGSEAAVAWHYDGGGPKGGTHYTTYAGRTDVKAKSGNPAGLIGNYLISSDGSVEDVRTGDVTHLALHDPSKWIGATGPDSWLEFHPPGWGGDGIDRYRSGQVVATYTAPPVEGADPPYGGWIVSLGADDQGWLVWAQSPRAGSRTEVVSSLAYLDFATGSYTVLDRDNGEWLGAMDATWVAWCRDFHTVVFAPRAALALQRTIGVAACHGVVLSGNDIAVLTSETGSDHKTHSAVLTGPLLGSLTKVSSSMPIGFALPAANGDFAVNAGSTAKDAGIYHLAAGSSSLGSPIVRWGPATAVPWDLVASQGRLYTRDGHGVEQRLVHVSSGGPPSYGGASRVISGGGIDSADGARTARVQVVTSRSTATWHVIVQDGTKVIGRYTVPSYSYEAVVSGNRVLVPHMAPDPNAQPWGGGAVVIDLKTGRRTSMPETTAFSGSRIAYLRPDGEVRVRDLVTGREQMVRPAGRLASCLRPSLRPVAISGDWVLWVLGDCSGHVAEAVAADTATGRRVSLTHALRNMWGLWSPIQIDNGRIAWLDSQPATVHVMSLADRKDRVVGTALKSRVDWLALSDHFLAWVASDTRRHVLAL